MKRYVYIDDDESSHDIYCDNRISNRKYTVLNFLPKNLWEQFSRFMNQYFLLIACLQLWPLITPVNPASTWGPLIFIFAVSASKEAWDDYNRYLSDKKANEKEIWVVKKGIKKHIEAQDIHVGNIVWLRENDEVPCDLVLIGTSDPQGVCYVETAALDGETDLKTRVIPSACAGIDVELLHKIKGVIECPCPDKDIRRFDANMRLFPPFIDNDICPLTIKNTILQSCYLRNTEWACGVAVYTGNETKMGMSRGIPEPKLTAMDAMIDKLTGAIFIFQIVVVLVLGIAGNVWKETEAKKQWYVLYPHEGPWYELLVIPLRFELLCSIMIPISIKVSLDLVKSLYAKFIDWDNKMIDLETSIPSHATNTAISEDLGQVEYILTDKTGTLTENKMIFRRCCISGNLYGNENGDALKDVELINAVSSGSSDVVRFLTIMAICNTVIPTRSKTGDILYKAQSQDEDALVQAAAQMHMIYFNKSGNILEVKFNSSILQYEVLEILEFTSDRKRMSVVLKDCQNGKILLLSKGADEAILPFARAGQQTRHFIEAVEQYAHLGLRTLCLAWRELKKDEYREWSLMFKEASSTLVDREWRVAEICQRVEHDLEILGVTAIEDRLQDGVPETIETLRKAGINFWMLTGDKQNTAIQIALSCNFISPEPKGQLLSIDGKTEEEVCRSLERVLRTMRITTSEPKDVAFVVDGWALEIALTHYRKAFTELAILSRTAICCRVTPSQKAQLVQILKSCDYRTLAIGDGGNDVRMIQQADIGVGISGREGLQAARAADYSIGKFRFLKRLILVHGRYSYNRTAFLSQYSFYKSLLICFIQIFFSFISGVSGTSLFNSVSLMAYNVFYTSVPVLVSVLDKDLSEETVMQHPQILFYCQAGRLLNPSTFAGWFGRSLFHAIVVFVISIHAYAYDKSEMEEVSMVALSGCIWLQAFVVTMETNSFTILQHMAIWGNLAAFYVINWIFSDIDEEESLSFGDLNEVMTATPTSRKRGHPSEIFCEAEIRQICVRCDVPAQYIEQVVRIIKSTFGTPELDVIALEEFMPGNVVVFVGTLIFESIDCGEEFVDLSLLPSFLRHIQERYDGNMPFHNATHAADVMHTLFMMLWNTSLGEKISQHNQVGALLAAVMHDVEHVGLTNDFLIKTSHPIAQKYPTKAPMESKHMDLALQAVVDPKFNILSKMSPANQEQILEVVRETISATALIYQPELLAEINGTTAEEWKLLEEEGAVLPQSLQVRALRIAMHVSDISQTMKPFANHQKWVFRLNDEHYRQGELDAREQRGVSPSFCFREQWTYDGFLCSQVCFLRKMALPAVVALNNIPWLDVNELVNGIEKNIAEWEHQQSASSH